MQLNNLDSDEDWGDLNQNKRVNGTTHKKQNNNNGNSHQSHLELYNT